MFANPLVKKQHQLLLQRLPFQGPLTIQSCHGLDLSEWFLSVSFLHIWDDYVRPSSPTGVNSIYISAVQLYHVASL